METEVIEPTYQQRLVTGRLEELFEAINVANTEHDKRAEKMSVISGGIVAFLGGASAIPGSDFMSSPISMVSLTIVFLIAVYVFSQCAKIWRPASTNYPSTPNTEELYERYISQDVYDAYNHDLKSLASCVSGARKTNNKKSNLIDTIMLCVQLQIIFVAITLGLKSLGWQLPSAPRLTATGLTATGLSLVFYSDEMSKAAATAAA